MSTNANDDRLRRSKKKSRNKYPEKRTINLLYRTKSRTTTVIELLVFTVFTVLTVLFSQFFVIDRLSRADEAEKNYQHAEEKLETIKRANENYAEVRAKYSHYGNGYLNETELAMQDRITMLNVIDERVHAAGGIQNIQIVDNMATLNVEVQNANRLTEIIESLEKSVYVSYVTASVASTQNDKAGAVSATPDGSLIGDRLVNAVISVYFHTPEEVEIERKNGTEEESDARLDAGHGGMAIGENAYVPSISKPEVLETEPQETASHTESGATTVPPVQQAATKTIEQRAADQAARQEQVRRQIAQQQAKAAQAQQIAAQQAAQAAQQAAAQQAANQAAAQAQNPVQQQSASIDTPKGSNNIFSLQGGAAPF